MNRLLAIALVCSLGADWRPTLDDERLDAIWQSAVEYDYPKLCLNQGVYHDARYEIGPIGQRNTLAGMEFPWRDPGGRFRSDLSRTYRSADARCDAVTARYRNVPNTAYRGNVNYILDGWRDYDRPAWQWREGAVFFELHFHERGHAFELRVLEKTSDGYGFDHYDAYVFRPVNAADDLPGKPHETLTKRVSSGHPTNPFKAEGQVTLYEDSSTDWREFVNRIWVDSTGHDFHHAGVGDYHLTPRNYHGWMTGSDRESCRKCHDQAGAPVQRFELVRDWYGYLPGADGTFSTGPPPSLRGHVARGHTRVR